MNRKVAAALTVAGLLAVAGTSSACSYTPVTDLLVQGNGAATVTVLVESDIIINSEVQLPYRQTIEKEQFSAITLAAEGKGQLICIISTGWEEHPNDRGVRAQNTGNGAVKCEYDEK